MATTTGKLSLNDIADLREYERERADFRAHVIALKKRRRVHIGPVITLVFENRDTIRFQIQEMARVEKLITDEAIQGELDAYNTLIPEAGQLCATVFIELTADDAAAPVAAQARRDRALDRAAGGRGARRAPAAGEARGRPCRAAHPRGRRRRPCTTSSGSSTPTRWRRWPATR